MSNTVAVLSKVPGLLKHLHNKLPNVSFQEITLPENAKLLPTSEILIADPDLLAPFVHTTPQTKWVQSTWAGLDALRPFVDAKNPPSFTLTRFSGKSFAQLMSQYVIAQITNFERGFFKYHDLQKSREWDESVPEFRTFAELAVGIMGVGNIGFGIGRDLSYLGAEVYGYGRSERKDLGYLEGYYTKPQLGDFLKKVDYVVNVMPTTKETQGLLNGGILKNCKERSAVFINIGRGSIMGEAELMEAIEKKWLRGAVLDVFQVEPLPKESRLWKIPQVHITPHISGPTIAKDVAEVFADNYALYKEGKPLLFTVDWLREY